MNIISQIIEWFKSVFNISVQEKPSNEYTSDFSDTNGISVTAALSERLSTLTLSDSSVTIYGDNARAKYIGEFAQKLFETKLQSIAEVCLGTGDCVVKPNTDGKRFGIDIIENKDFRIVESMGDFVYSMLIKCDQMKIGTDIYERWEYHKLDEADGKQYESITQVCFKNGKQVPIESCPGWDNIQETKIIPNVDRLLIGRFQCPKLNREDVNSPNGVPITYGADEIVNEAKASWRRFNQEFNDKETMIFADKSLFKNRTVKKTVNGEAVTEKIAKLPEGKERVIMDVSGSGSVDGNRLIHEYSPAIRDVSLEAEIERNFRMLELFCGLSEGLLSKSTLTYTNTDEVRKSTQATFAFITSFRKVLAHGIDDLLYAIDMICNVNEITPPGSWESDYDWSDSFVESMTERFNQLLQGQAIGAIGLDEVRSWIQSESLEQSQEWLKENSDNMLQDIEE